MESLTKENFWNELERKFPAAMKVFGEWIDEYKRKNDWNNKLSHRIKFHDLPLAMQMGIFSEFVFEKSDMPFPDIGQLKDQIEDFVIELDRKVKKK